MSESTTTPPTAASGAQREGLRGIASTFIVASHLARSYWGTIISPSQSEQTLGNVFHLPILRLPSIGQAWVAVFLTLTGYVVALKPIRQARTGEISKALSDLTSASLKRPARLILPTTVATIAIWVMAQLGAFKMGKASGVGGVHDTSPLPSDSFGSAIQDLYYNLFTTWSTSENYYDHHQWAMMYILLGSMMVFLTLLATIRCSPPVRVTVFVGLYVFNWAKFEPLYMNVYGGAALAELGILFSHWSRHLDRLSIRIISYLLIFLGLILCGCPERDYEWTSWSSALYHIGWQIFPKEVSYQNDYWSSIGTQIFIVGIICAPSVQRLLSLPALVWLGSISLPVYLLHGPLMRSVLIWMLFGWRKAGGNGGMQAPPTWEIYVCLPIFFFMLFAISHAWNMYVEPWCAWVTNKTAEWMFRKGAEHGEREAVQGDDQGDEMKEGLLLGQV